ncbi:MAG: hypothetical protein V3S67_03200 [Gammaproteobacteria bacterium]
MRAFVRWVLERRYRLVLLAIVFAPIPILFFVTTALLTLETIRRGGLQGTYSALAGTAGILAVAFISGADSRALVTVGLIALFAGVALGVLVRRANSLALAFQGSLLVCVVAVIGANAFWPDPGVLIGVELAQFLETFRASGATEEQLAIMRGWDTVFFGVAGAAVFLELVAALLLGYWWNSLGGPDGRFGLQFRMLRLGRVLGVPATLLMAASLVLDVPLVQNLFPLALLGFWFQGLAVSHAWARAKRWHPTVLGAAYVLLISPLTGLVILVMGSVGLIDNWIDLRAPLHPLT